LGSRFLSAAGGGEGGGGAPGGGPPGFCGKGGGYCVKAVGPLGDGVKGLEVGLQIRPAPEAPLSAEQIAPLVLPAMLAEVERVVSELPRPENGKDGDSVTIDDIHPILMLELSKWALDFERRAQDVLERAISRMPAAKDGVDGLGFDDLSMEHDGERRFCLRFTRGEQSKEFPFRLPVFIDRGVFKEGVDYEQGDGVTFGGSFWIAQKDDPTGKPGLSDDWRLCVRRGRDSK